MPKIPDSKGKMFQIPEFGAQTKLPALQNLGSHTQGEITNQTYLANGINSDTLPKEDKKTFKPK